MMNVSFSASQAASNRPPIIIFVRRPEDGEAGMNAASTNLSATMPVRQNEGRLNRLA